MTQARRAGRQQGGIEHATATEGARTCTLAGGTQLEEDIVNVDEALRRFQCRITGGMPVESPLGTVDLFEDGNDGAIVVYSTEVEPGGFADMMGPSIERGVAGLKTQPEGSG